MAKGLIGVDPLVWNQIHCWKEWKVVVGFVGSVEWFGPTWGRTNVWRTPQYIWQFFLRLVVLVLLFCSSVLLHSLLSTLLLSVASFCCSKCFCLHFFVWARAVHLLLSIQSSLVLSLNSCYLSSWPTDNLYFLRCWSLDSCCYRLPACSRFLYSSFSLL